MIEQWERDGCLVSLLCFSLSSPRLRRTRRKVLIQRSGGFFHIARSVNKNLVCYDVNLRDGKLDTHDPLNVYWVNREKHPGETNGLSYIQRKMAYGYKLISASDNACVCSLTAYPSRQLTITKRDSRYVCYITINNQQAILQSLYVKASSKNPLSVEYVELQGISVATNQPVTERVRK